MATVTNLTDGGTTGSATSATTASVSPTGDALVLLAVTAYDSADNLSALTPSISGGGMTSWELVARNDYDTTASDYSSLWLFRAQQASPGSGTITIDFGATSVSRISWAVDQVDGATVGNNGADAIVQYDNTPQENQSGGGSGSLASSLSAFSDAGNVAYGAFGVQTNNPAVFTVGSGFSELGKFDTSTSFAQILTEYQAGDHDPGASWTSAAVYKAGAIAVEVGTTTVTLHEVLPDSDITTTGWTSTPLWSKINDDSDGTVIQATAS